MAAVIMAGIFGIVGCVGVLIFTALAIKYRREDAAFPLVLGVVMCMFGTAAAVGVAIKKAEDYDRQHIIEKQ